MNGLYIVIGLVVLVAILETEFVATLLALAAIAVSAYAFYLWTAAP